MALIALLMLAATPAFATTQSNWIVPPCNGYTVQTGDTAWQLAEKYHHDATSWRKWVWDANLQIHEPGRLFVNGQRITILILKPGECLQGLTNTGDIQKPAFVPPPAQPKAVHATASKPVVASGWFDGILPLFWLLFAILAAIALALWLERNRARERAKALNSNWNDEYRRAETALTDLARERAARRSDRTVQDRVLEMNRDPVNAGPPVIHGGVNNLEDASTHLLDIAARQTGIPAAQLKIEQVTSGRVWGYRMVRFGDGRVEGFNHTGQRAFRGFARLPSGKRKVVYFLRECGNDLSGMEDQKLNSNFCFVPDAVQPTETPVASAPVPQTAPAAAEPVVDAGPAPAVDSEHPFVLVQPARPGKPAMRVLHKGVGLSDVRVTNLPNGVEEIILTMKQ